MTPGSFYFDPLAKGLEVFLGPTEAQLMELAWKHRVLTVKKALFHLGEKDDRAYTTVMTVLSRLAKKGLLDRRKSASGGRSFEYAPALSRDEFIKQRVKSISQCIKQFK
jgi:predicted transcriptional regulator